jgi:hypothetical protein
MLRWKYISVEPDPADPRPKPRFGEDTVAGLRDSLQAIAAQLDPALPDCLPILGYGLFSAPGDGPAADPAATAGPRPRASPGTVPPSGDLPALLSRVLLALAIEFERESPLSLAICADVLRVLDEDGYGYVTCPACPGCPKRQSVWRWGSSASGGSPSPGQPRTAAAGGWPG